MIAFTVLPWSPVIQEPSHTIDNIDAKWTRSAYE
jgi:hypothetical protein